MTLALSLAGCASDQAQANRLETITALTVVRYPTPAIQRHSESTIVGGGLLLGGFGMEAAAGAAGTKLSERCALADFGLLVMGEFAAKAPASDRKVAAHGSEAGAGRSPYTAKDVYVLVISARRGLGVLVRCREGPEQ